MLAAWGVTAMSPYSPANLDRGAAGPRHHRQRDPARERRGHGGARARHPADELSRGVRLPRARGQAQRRRGRHARQDDDVGAPGARARLGRHRSVVPRRRRDAQRELATSASGTASSSWWKGTSTTPPTSTRGRSSCTTARARRSSRASSSTTRTSTATWRTTSRRTTSSPRRSPRTASSPWRRRIRTRWRSRSARRARTSPPTRRRATADYATENLRFGPEGARFTVVEPRGRAGEFLLPMSGHHNVENALGVYAAARALGLKADDIRAGFASFEGVKRRQEIRGERERRARDRRLRASPDGGARDDRRDPPALPRPAALGGVRAAVEHEPAQHPPARVRRARSRARRSRRSACRSRTTRCRSTSSSTSARSSTRCARAASTPTRRRDVDELVRRVIDRRGAGRRRPRDEQRQLRRVHPVAARRAEGQVRLTTSPEPVE